jgi:hypothetical protein
LLQRARVTWRPQPVSPQQVPAVASRAAGLLGLLGLSRALWRGRLASTTAPTARRRPRRPFSRSCGAPQASPSAPARPQRPQRPQRRRRRRAARPRSRSPGRARPARGDAGGGGDRSTGRAARVCARSAKAGHARETHPRPRAHMHATAMRKCWLCRARDETRRVAALELTNQTNFRVSPASHAAHDGWVIP